MRYLIEAPEGSRYFFPEENGLTVVAFTRGDHGEDLIRRLQEASDEGYISGDFQIVKVVE